MAHHIPGDQILRQLYSFYRYEKTEMHLFQTETSNNSGSIFTYNEQIQSVSVECSCGWEATENWHDWLGTKNQFAGLTRERADEQIKERVAEHRAEIQIARDYMPVLLALIEDINQATMNPDRLETAAKRMSIILRDFNDE